MVISVASDAVQGRSREARRRLPAAQRRALIEQAAARLFAARGYAATTVEDIVAEAGVSKPMLYRHFESKKELQMKLLERRRDELAAAALDSLLGGGGDGDGDGDGGGGDGDGDGGGGDGDGGGGEGDGGEDEGEPRGRLPAMVDAWFAHVEQHPDTSRVLFQDATGDADIQALQRELRRRQRAADVALLREFAPQLPEAELEPLGEIVRSSLTGLALWWLDNPGVPREVPVAAVVRVTEGVLLSVAKGVPGRGSADD